MSKSLKIVNYLIYQFLVMYLFVDSITGYCLNKGIGLSLSVPFKILIMFLMICVILAEDKNLIMKYLFFGLLLLVTLLFGVSTNPSSVIQSFIKCLSFIVFYDYFRIKDNINQDKIDRIIKINLFVFIFNIYVIGLSGRGFSTYSYGVGYKGFFYAGNEIFLVLSSILVLLVINKGNVNLKNKFFIIAMITSLLIGTKTAFLLILLLTVYDVRLYASIKKKIASFVVLIIIIFIIYSLWGYVITHFSVVDNAVYNIQSGLRKTNSSILNVLLSGRISFLRNNIKEWNRTESVFQVLFGGANFYCNKTTEIDIIDTFIQNGLIFTSIILSFYVYLIAKAYKKSKLLCLYDILILLVSFTAGHIWTNLTGGLFFIIANLYTVKIEIHLKERSLYFKKVN